MNSKLRIALKTTSIIFLSIVSMLFLIFLLTIDLENPKSYKYDITKESIREELIDKLENSLEESKTVNLFNLELDSELLNKFAYSTFFLEDNGSKKEYVVLSKAWALKGFEIGFQDEKIVISFHVYFSASIRYNFKLSLYLKVSENKDSYSLELENISLGLILLPRTLIKSTLMNDEEDSIGYVISNFLSNLSFAVYDKDSMTITIYKRKIVDLLSSGELGNLIFKDKNNEKNIFSSIVLILYKNGLITTSIKNKLIFKIDYSKLLSEEDEFTYHSSDYQNVKYDFAFLKFLGNESISLTDIQRSTFLSNLVIRDTSSSIRLYKASDEIYQDEVHFLFKFLIFDRPVNINLLYFKENDSLSLREIEIGKDIGEREASYIKTSDQETINKILTILSSYGFYNRINLRNLYLPLTKELSQISLSFNNIEISLQTNELIDEIKATLFNDDFYDSFSIELKELINYQTEEQLIQSFTSLELSHKILFYNNLKYYFNDNALVYNYICNILD